MTIMLLGWNCSKKQGLKLKKAIKGNKLPVPEPTLKYHILAPNSDVMVADLYQNIKCYIFYSEVIADSFQLHV